MTSNCTIGSAVVAGVSADGHFTKRGECWEVERAASSIALIHPC